ncbi:hypothetical protein [Aquihabitans sp. McL0605]|uniref:hypothetical protein n=1 Tax=Aquihabitans sp. McL0605 TaxID=3415671 RepID=UPI003CF0E316
MSGVRTSGSRRKRRARIALGVAAVGAATIWQPLLPAGASNPPEPTYGTATVDGSPGEWSGGDIFGSLYSNHPPYTALATASLRYDCDAKVLYVYVAASDGVILQTLDPEEDYVRVGGGGKIVDGLSGNDGTAPDFAFVGQTADGATGWEASGPLAEGSYPASLRIHAKVPDQSSDGYQVLDLKPRYSDLTVTCPQVIASTTVPDESTTTAAKGTSTTATTEPQVEGAHVEAPPAEPVVSGATALTG